MATVTISLTVDTGAMTAAEFLRNATSREYDRMKTEGETRAQFIKRRIGERVVAEAKENYRFEAALAISVPNDISVS